MQTPPAFNFNMTVFSHGWYSLLPFSVNAGRNELVRILDLPGGTTVQCAITSANGGIRIRCKVGGGLSREQRDLIRTQVAGMFRLNEDFTDFHRSMRRSSNYRWIARSYAGRLLRAPTVFEDMVKMICTTNCTWALTTSIVSNLVGLLGPVSTEGWQSFPGASRLAGSTEHFLRKEVKSGYRAPYLVELAERVASGKLDPESWRSSSLPTGDLLKELLTVKGIGPYAAQNMLRLLGRYDFLALDSWVRSKYYSLFHKGRRVKDSTIVSRYSSFGEWRGLVFWLEMTRDWHDDKFLPARSERKKRDG